MTKARQRDPADVHDDEREHLPGQREVDAYDRFVAPEPVRWPVRRGSAAEKNVACRFSAVGTVLLSRDDAGGYAWRMKIVVRWLLLAAALLLVAQIYSGVVVTSFTSALIAAFVLGLFNTLLRPILVLLTLPVTVLTLGLFLFVINALMFYFAASVLQGFSVTGFVAALIGSLLYSLCGLVIDAAMERIFQRG